MHHVQETTVEGLAAVRLSSPSGVTATFVPGAGMVGCSLTHEGEELLETRGGVQRYVERRSTMGIPFLHPWGNRLGSFAYDAGGQHVELSADDPVLRLEGNGLPMHGALAAVPGWQVESMLAGEGEARLVARFDYAAREDLLAVFPYPHTIEQAITLEGERLTVATTLTATGEAPVPIAFGWHPYLKLPGTPAEFWQLDLPVTDRIVTDERAIPTGEIEDVPIVLGPMGDQTWDDGFRLAQDGMRFSLEDDRRKIEIDFEHGYAVAIIWRPEDGEFICIEPMTAPTNALVSGDGLRLMQPGEMFTAIFSIAVTPS